MLLFIQIVTLLFDPIYLQVCSWTLVSFRFFTKKRIPDKSGLTNQTFEEFSHNSFLARHVFSIASGPSKRLRLAHGSVIDLRRGKKSTGFWEEQNMATVGCWWCVSCGGKILGGGWVVSYTLKKIKIFWNFEGLVGLVQMIFPKSIGWFWVHVNF